MLKTVILKNLRKNKEKYKIGTVVSMPRGYGRYLIKQGKVLAATEENEQKAKLILVEEDKKRGDKLKKAKVLMEKLSKEKISFIVSNYNGNGIFFGAIKTEDIVNAIHKLSKDYHEIKSQDVILDQIIKIHGIYFVTVYLYELELKIPVIAGKSELDLKVIYENYLNRDKIKAESMEENLKDGEEGKTNE